MSESESSHFQIELHDRVLVIQFISPQLYEHLVLNEVEQELKEALREYKPRHVVFDFSNVDFCSSSIISAMLNVRRSIKKSGGSVAIAELKPIVEQAFRVLGLDSQVFARCATTKLAVEYLQSLSEDDTVDG